MKFILIVLVCNFGLFNAADEKDKLHAITPYIINGEVAAQNQLPYQVGLLLHTTEGDNWCGGTIISNKHILTAAHCMDSIAGVDVFMGARNITNRLEKGQLIVSVNKNNIRVHSEWNSKTVENDIALITLPTSIKYDANKQPAILPKTQGDSYPNYNGKKAYVSGWGRTRDSEEGVTPVLRYGIVEIISNFLCSFAFPFMIESSNICIRTLNAPSACSGDSGGPLVLADGSNTLIGIVSFGLGISCEIGWPCVFTRVSSYVDWIREQTDN